MVDGPLADDGVVFRLGGAPRTRKAERTFYDGQVASVRLCCICGTSVLIAANPPDELQRLEREFWRDHTGTYHAACDEQFARWVRCLKIARAACVLSSPQRGEAQK